MYAKMPTGCNKALMELGTRVVQDEIEDTRGLSDGSRKRVERGAKVRQCVNKGLSRQYGREQFLTQWKLRYNYPDQVLSPNAGSEDMIYILHLLYLFSQIILRLDKRLVSP
jgi:hypothetical protein